MMTAAKISEAVLAYDKGMKLEWRNDGSEWQRSAASDMMTLLDYISRGFEYRACNKWQNLIDFVNKGEFKGYKAIRFGRKAADLREMQEFLFANGIDWGYGRKEYIDGYGEMIFYLDSKRMFHNPAAHEVGSMLQYSPDTCQFIEAPPKKEDPEQTFILNGEVFVAVEGTGCTGCHLKKNCAQHHLHCHRSTRKDGKSVLWKRKDLGPVTIQKPAEVKPEVRTYKARQDDYVTVADARLGDSFRVVKRVESTGAAHWVPSMNDYIDAVGKLTEIQYNGLRLIFDDGYYWTFDYECLEKIGKPALPEHVDLDTKGTVGLAKTLNELIDYAKYIGDNMPKGS